MLAIFPEISAAVQTGNMEQVSILARRYFAVGSWSAPYIDVARLIESGGISITRLRLREYGAIAVKDERGSVHCSIAIRDSLAPEEEAFLLAHLLGHFLLHIQPRIARTEWSTSGFREEVLPSHRYTQIVANDKMTSSQLKMELEADQFAAALLMPAAMLVKASESLKSIEKVAKLFSVEPEMISQRLQSLATSRHISESTVPENKMEIRSVSSPIEKNFETSPKQKLIKGAKKEDTAHMVREKHHQPAPTPRAIAAQSYSTNQTPAEAPKEPVSGKGMERLREIARLLDKSGR